MKDDILSIQ